LAQLVAALHSPRLRWLRECSVWLVSSIPPLLPSRVLRSCHPCVLESGWRLAHVRRLVLRRSCLEQQG
jgi:hypothetical protein